MKVLQTYKIAASIALVLASGAAFAQNITDQVQTQSGGGVVREGWQPSLVRDGAYDKVAHVGQALEWQPIREADVLWKKRVWREIDSREKQNMAFRFPGDENSGGGFFIEILLDAIKKGKVKAYSNFDDRFTTAMTKDAIIEMTAGKLDTNYVIDPETGEERMVISRKEFNPESVTKFRIKEEWVFDRNVGKMVVQIIGLSPLKDIYNESDGSFRASQPMFWLYYPEIRSLLAQYEVFNPENDVYRMTWDEFFEGRFFSSKVVKVSNPFDMTFREQGATPMEALYESQRTAEDLFNKEHDMWVY